MFDVDIKSVDNLVFKRTVTSKDMNKLVNILFLIIIFCQWNGVITKALTTEGSSFGKTPLGEADEYQPSAHVTHQNDLTNLNDDSIISINSETIGLEIHVNDDSYKVNNTNKEIDENLENLVKTSCAYFYGKIGGFLLFLIWLCILCIKVTDQTENNQ